MARVTLSDVNKYFDSVRALADVSLEIEDGEFAVFVGPSGCGKSTLLRSIAGLEGISSGSVMIGETDVSNAHPSDRDVAMVFQSYALYPHMSVRRNMEFGMKVNGVPAGERNERVLEAARVLQIEEYLDRKPAQLSGGQRQRVAIGRAIVKKPQVFLFDEPLSNLDAKLRIQMRIELEALHQQLGVTMIYVTHDQVEAMTMADKIIVLNDGKVEQIGKPMQLYHQPRTEFVAGFIGAPSMNFLDVRTEKSAVAYGGSRLTEIRAPGEAHRIGIRPEHVLLVKPGSGHFDAKISVKEELGGESFLYLDSQAGDRIVVKTSGEDQTASGTATGVKFPFEHLHFFGVDGTALQKPAAEKA